MRAGNQSRQGNSIPPEKLFRPAESALVFLIIWILLEIVSNFVQQTPPSFTFSEIEIHQNYENHKSHHKTDDERDDGLHRYHRESSKENQGVENQERSHQYPESAYHVGHYRE